MTSLPLLQGKSVSASTFNPHSQTPLFYLETARTICRIAQPQDVASVLTYMERNRAFLTPFEPIKPDGYFTLPFWRQQIQWDHSDFRHGRRWRIFIFDRQTQDVIGVAHFSNILRAALQACSLGYSLDEGRGGQGLMTEALSAVIPEVFRQLKLHRIQANYMPSNKASGRVLEKLGFQVEGQARQYLRLNGQWEDHVLTSLINPDDV